MPAASPLHPFSGFAGVVGVTLAMGLGVGCPAEVATPGDCVGASCVKPDVNQDPPRLFVDPPFGLGYDCVTLGCDVERRMIVENRGGGVVRLVLARLTVASSNDFQLRRGDGGPLPTGDTDAIEITPSTPLELFVRYSPSDGVADTGAVTLRWHDGAVAFEDAVLDEVELPLTTRALGDVAAEPSTERLNFGFVPLGGYATRDVVVRNVGNGGVLSVGPVSRADEAQTVFAEVGGTWGEQFVNPNEEATITVAFRPEAVGTVDGVLFVQSTDAAAPAIRIEVTGTSFADPAIQPSATELDFQAIRVATSRTLQLTVRNGGGGPLAFTPVVLSGHGVTTPTDNVIVPPLDSVTIPVTFSPTVGGQMNGTLQLQSNDPATPVIDVALSGFSNAPQLAATPATVDFGDVVQSWTTGAQTFFLRNTGHGELTVSSLSFEVGSSTQIQFAEVPTLPVKISPDDPPVAVSVFMEASTLGTQTAVVLVGTDGIDGPLGQAGVGRLTATGRVVTCDEGCPVANGSPSCNTGECRIGTCDSRFHDADNTFSSGCECGEDLVPAGGGTRRDVPGVCGGQDLGTLNDKDNPRSTTFTGTLHDETDVDLFFFRANDQSQFLNDDYGARVDLQSGPPGLRLFARFASAGTGCGGENQRVGPVGVGQGLQGRGNSTSDNSEDVTFWVEWAPGAAPVCATYTIRARADNDN